MDYKFPTVWKKNHKIQSIRVILRRDFLTHTVYDLIIAGLEEYGFECKTYVAGG